MSFCLGEEWEVGPGGVRVGDGHGAAESGSSEPSLQSQHSTGHFFVGKGDSLEKKGEKKILHQNK